MDTSAAHVIAKCGGPQAVADMLGVDFTTVHKWKYPRSRGGTDGRIPTGRQHELLRKAREAGIDLAPDDFFRVGVAEPIPTDVPRPATVEAA